MARKKELRSEIEALNTRLVYLRDRNHSLTGRLADATRDVNAAIQRAIIAENRVSSHVVERDQAIIQRDNLQARLSNVIANAENSVILSSDVRKMLEYMNVHAEMHGGSWDNERIADAAISLLFTRWYAYFHPDLRDVYLKDGDLGDIRALIGEGEYTAVRDDDSKEIGPRIRFLLLYPDANQRA